MSTAQIWQTNSTNLDDTLRVAQQIGQNLKGGEVIELVSDLGGGKTAFVKGLAAGTGSNDKVHSPSFTLNNQYIAEKLNLYHFDFYRLNEAGIMRDELAEILQDPNAVIAIEWGDLIDDVLPTERLTINIIVTGENTRKFEFTYPEKLSYLFPNT
jgi:tRNA threonylcarbamoyladenosine biosynthesis protein TsaE